MTSPKTLLTAWNIKAKKKLGQHFLADPSTADMIVARAKISSDDIVLDIGAGLGALTIPLAKAAAKVYAVEKDQRLYDLLKTELLVQKVSNATLIPKDILQLDYQPIFAENGRRLIVFGNLPYNISSQIIIKLIRSRNFVQRAILMFQKELAQRLIAQPGSKDYGRLTVMLHYCANVKTIANIGASVFFPTPKIASEVLELDFEKTVDYPEHDEAMLFQVIKAAFGNRRKTLKNALVASGLRINPKTAKQALESAGIDASRRAETLSVTEFIALQISLSEVLPIHTD
jgi:16S rRNA (adenine1518-N6/adenine1519-N6)-dimethyltransferase